MKRLVSLFIMLLSFGILSPTTHAEEFKTLRGKEAVQGDPAFDHYRWEKDRKPLQRQFVQQPPLIPHTTKGYLITKEFNKCLDCHSWDRTSDTGATKISITHFKTRGGTELTNVSPRRYFCQQCHVPQTDAKPLVGNTFQPAAGMVK